jgi:hypothetical protein
MSTKFFQLTNLPPLSPEIIADGLDDQFEFTVSPYALGKRASLFYETNFYKLLTDQYGEIICKYIRNPANSYYDWHVDKTRQSALNWVIDTNPGAGTFFRGNNRAKFFWDLEEVVYSTSCPTLINTTQEHCVFNNYPKERTILTLTVRGAYSYDTVLEFLQSVNIKQY